jgi:hypothetical protein
VPACNPHDEAELAPNLPAALEQLWQIQAAAMVAASPGSGSGGGGGGLERLAAAYAAALAAGQAALQQEVDTALAAPAGSAAAAGGGGGDADAVMSGLEVIKVASGSRVSNALVAALEVLAAANAAAAAATATAAGAAAGATAGSKKGVPGGAQVEAEVPPDGTAEFLVGALVWLALRAMPTPLLADLSAALLDAAGRAESDGGAAAAAAGVQLRHYHELLSPRRGAARGAPASNGGSGDSDGDLLALAEGLLRSSDGSSGGGGGEGRAERAQLALPLRPGMRMAVAYRASKKMVLTDALAAVAGALGLRVPELEAELGAWAARGRGSKAPPPPWRTAPAEVAALRPRPGRGTAGHCVG